MMGRVGVALIWHELGERTRDRWVLVISALFALLASAVSLYGRSAEAEASQLTGPSLVTLVGLFIPLVALVLGHDAIVGERERNTLGLLLSLPVSRFEVVMAKFAGRALALGCAVGLGLGAAILLAPRGQGQSLQLLLGPTLLLGTAFLSFGIFISAVASRQITAASLVVSTWFLLVFFYDLALLGLLVVTDGAVSQSTIQSLTVANPGGLFRLQMMEQFAGPDALQDLGVAVRPPEAGTVFLVWAAWLLVPVGLSGWLLSRRG